MNTAGQNGGNSFGNRLASSDRNPAPRNGGGSDGGVAAQNLAIAVIGSGITIHGNVEAEVDLQIDGRVNGDVRCGTLLLSEAGMVQGNVIAERVRLNGQIDGGLDATDVAIEAGARIKGEVTYSRLRIANGGIIEGTLAHRPLEQGAEETPRAQPRVHHIE